MAKNWKVAEAVLAIKEGDKSAIADIGRRFPLFAVAAAQVNDEAIAILECLPDYCTARKIESVLKEGVGPVEEAEDEEVEEKVEKKKTEKKATKPATKGKGKKKDEDDDDLSGKSAKELYDLCVEQGLDVKARQKAEVYIKALENAKSEEDDDDWGEDEEEEKPKAKKAAKKAPAKKKAKEEDDEDDDDDDWDI